MLESSYQSGNRISGVILAGGDNKRFGGLTKANIVIGGETIISRIVNVIRDFFEEIIIVTNTPSDFKEFSHCRIIGDHFPKAGPLGGIHAALKASAKEAAFIFAGDMPFLSRKIITDQINAFGKSETDILIPGSGNFTEPLHAIYRVSILTDLETFLAERESRSIRDFISEMNVEYLQLDESDENKIAFTNINSPSDIGKITFDF